MRQNPEIDQAVPFQILEDPSTFDCFKLLTPALDKDTYYGHLHQQDRSLEDTVIYIFSCLRLEHDHTPGRIHVDNGPTMAHNRSADPDFRHDHTDLFCTFMFGHFPSFAMIK